MRIRRANNVEPISEMRRICQRDTELRNWVTDWYPVLARKISIYFTKFFLILNVTANQVTLLQSSFGVLGALFFVFGNYWSSIAGITLLQFFAILDHADGEVARYNRAESRQGKFLDVIGGNLVLHLFSSPSLLAPTILHMHF